MAGPRWVRLDTGYFRNRKVRRAGRDGRILHLASICFVGDQKTDGHIYPDDVELIARDAGVPQRTVDAVLGAGLWLPNGDGYELHDYLAFGNPSRAAIEAETERARLAKQKSRRDTPGRVTAMSRRDTAGSHGSSVTDESRIEMR